MCLSVKNNWTGSYIDEEMEVCRLLPAAQLTVAAPSCSITPLQKKKKITNDLLNLADFMCSRVWKM